MGEQRGSAVAALDRTSALPLAGLELRLVAFVLDIVVLVSFLMLFLAAAGLQVLFRSDFGEVDPPESAIYILFPGALLGWLAFLPLYYVLLWAWRGQTVGKMAVRIKVARSDGGPLGLGRASLRFVAYVASALPLFAGFLIAPFDRHRRALHDLIADTIVVELP